MDESVGQPTGSFSGDVDYPSDPVALPYSRYQRASLAPWLTGLILALVVFVILIPAFCSACYHYYSYKHGFEEDSDLDEMDYDGDMDEDEVDDCCEYCCTDEQHFEKTMLFQDTTACKPQSGAGGGGGLKLRLPEALSSCCSSRSKKHHSSHADLTTTPKSTCSSLPSEKSGGGQLIRTPTASVNNTNFALSGSQFKTVIDDFSTPSMQQGGGGMKLRLFKNHFQKDSFSPTEAAVDSSSKQTSGSDGRKLKPLAAGTPSPPPPPPTATNGSLYLSDLGTKLVVVGGGGGGGRKQPVSGGCLCPKHSSAAANASVVTVAAAATDYGVGAMTRDSETQTLVTSLIPSKHRFVRKKSETCKIANSMEEFRKSSSKKRCGRNHHNCALSNNSHVHAHGVHIDKFELVCETTQVERARDKYSAANEESYDF